MTRRAYINPSPSDDPLPAHAPKDAVKHEFARRLQAAMVAKGWTQSELARKAENHLPKNHKFGRDAISTYIRAKSLPGPVFLDALCKALGKKTEDLLPTTMMTPGNGSPPLKVQDMNDGFAWLTINQQVSWDKAVKILEILRGPDASDGSRN